MNNNGVSHSSSVEKTCFYAKRIPLGMQRSMECNVVNAANVNIEKLHS